MTYKVRGYKTDRSGNIYALCVERSCKPLSKNGCLGVIVPLSGFSTARMEEYQNLLARRYLRGLALSFYSGDAHPSSMCLTELNTDYDHPRVSTPKGGHEADYVRWYAFLAEERPSFAPRKFRMSFVTSEMVFCGLQNWATPTARKRHKEIEFDRRACAESRLPNIEVMATVIIIRSPVFWICSMDFEPYFKSPIEDRSTDHLKDLFFPSRSVAKRVGAIIQQYIFLFLVLRSGQLPEHRGVRH